MSVYGCGDTAADETRYCGAIRIGDFKLLLLHQEDDFYDWVSADASRVEHASQFEAAVCGGASSTARQDLFQATVAGAEAVSGNISRCVGVPCLFNIAEVSAPGCTKYAWYQACMGRRPPLPVCSRTPGRRLSLSFYGALPSTPFAACADRLETPRQLTVLFTID